MSDMVRSQGCGGRVKHIYLHPQTRVLHNAPARPIPGLQYRDFDMFMSGQQGGAA